MTLDAVARRMVRSQAWLSTVETGLQPIHPDDLVRLLDFYDVPDGPLRESLLHLAAQGQQKNWGRAYEGRISAAALDLASLEADSAQIRTFQPNLVPGLLQIEMYTRALIAAGLPSTTRDIAELVTFRMARQAVLARPDPPRYQAIIGESVLHHLVGDVSVMRAQLGRLIESARLNHVELRILPHSASAHLWLAGPFHLLALRPPGLLTVSVVENFTQSTFVEDQHEVTTHEEIFAHLLTASLDESQSVKVINRLMSEP